MGITVHLEPGAPADALRAGLLPFLERGELPPSARLVKEAVARDVHTLEVTGAGPLFVKRDRTRDILERAKHLLAPSRSLAEARSLARARAAGIDAPEPLVILERRRHGLLVESALVTRGLSGAVTLRERLLSLAAAPESGPPRAAGLVGAAGAILRKLHERALFHRDYHPGNILVRPEGGLALVDLQKMRPLPALPPLSSAARARDLALFLHDIDGLDGQAELAGSLEGRDRLRAAFLAGYGASPRLEDRVLRAVDARRRERLRSRARRCVVRSTQFRIDAVEAGRVPAGAGAPSGSWLRIYRRADVPLETVLATIDAHRRTLAMGPGTPGFVKRDAPATCLTRQPLAGVPDAEVAVKEFPARGVLASLGNFFRVHRGLACWLAAHALRVRGIETPEPLALVEMRRLGVVLGSFVLTRWLAGAEDAHLYAHRRFAQGRDAAPPGRARGPWGEGGERAPLGRDGEADVVLSLARYVRALHAEGIYHGDLKLPNFLVRDGAEGEPPRISLLDLDAVRLGLGGGLSRRRRVKNLAQIEDYTRYACPMVKRTHRARFLRAYGGDARLAAAVERHVQWRMARRARVKARLARQGRRFEER